MGSVPTPFREIGLLIGVCIKSELEPALMFPCTEISVLILATMQCSAKALFLGWLHNVGILLCFFVLSVICFSGPLVADRLSSGA